jgi:hypothetical protein
MNSSADWVKEDERELEAAMQTKMQAVREQMALSRKWLNEDEILQLEECFNEKIAQLIEERDTGREISHLGRRIYHEAPDDIMEHIVYRLTDKERKSMSRGGLNVLRLVSKRMKQVVESCASWLTNTREEDGPDSLPLDLLSRCRRIEHIKCHSHNLRSLEGCPNRLKTLFVGHGHHIESLEPLRGCSKLLSLRIDSESRITDLSPLSEIALLNSFVLMLSQVVDISPLASMPNLQSLSIMKNGQQSIKDLSPLSHCHSLRWAMLFGNTDIKDVSPLQGLSQLEMLDIGSTLTSDLIPLTNLPKLNHLRLNMMPSTTSLLPLLRCERLRLGGIITCDSNALDLATVLKQMPQAKFDITPEEDMIM